MYSKVDCCLCCPRQTSPCTQRLHTLCLAPMMHWTYVCFLLCHVRTALLVVNSYVSSPNCATYHRQQSSVKIKSRCLLQAAIKDRFEAWAPLTDAQFRACTPGRLQHEKEVALMEAEAVALRPAHFALPVPADRGHQRVAMHGIMRHQTHGRLRPKKEAEVSHRLASGKTNPCLTFSAVQSVQCLCARCLKLCLAPCMMSVSGYFSMSGLTF